jgi:lipopolysaccharide transport system ATP-binding protein
MSVPAIRIESLGKRYFRGSPGVRGALLAERMGNALRGVRRPAERAPAMEPFWALRNVSLEVAEGEAIGLMGPNGAGKSTLLKLMSRITPPTEGRIELHGRVATLLEVGTGFHPELTGRENVFLNGAILGLRRQDIARRFDEIVDFAGVEEFIDTPVKRYSSGMYVRLGFAVAAHLDAEIMFVDEVLAVGDAAYQRKCIQKIHDLTVEEGRTVVFVSHNLAWVDRLCDRALLIEHGEVRAEGPVASVTASYLNSVDPAEHGGVVQIPPSAPRLGTGEAAFRSVRLLDAEDGQPTHSLLLNRPLIVEAMLEVFETIQEGVFEVGITAADGLRIVTALSSDGGGDTFRLEPGVHELRAALAPPLLPGQFALDIGVHERLVYLADVDLVERVLQFEVGAADGDRETYLRTPHGYLRSDTHWEVGKPAVTAAMPASAPGPRVEPSSVRFRPPA